MPSDAAPESTFFSDQTLRAAAAYFRPGDIWAGWGGPPVLISKPTLSLTLQICKTHKSLSITQL